MVTATRRGIEVAEARVAGARAVMARMVPRVVARAVAVVTVAVATSRSSPRPARRC